MKTILFSRHYPTGHPKAGQCTHFVEKIWKSIWDAYQGANNPLYPYWKAYDAAFQLKGDIMENIHQHEPKHHTLRAGHRFKPGDHVSLRIWSDKPYRSKQIEFAQVEVKRVWPVTVTFKGLFCGVYSDGKLLQTCNVAKNDGLECDDFVKWFMCHPKKQGDVFCGQIIAWSDKIDY